MEEDDLPPRQTPPHEETAAGDFGRLVGTLVWVALFVGLAGAIAYIAIHWMG
ncbi:MAG TPA: hypothetical protein VGG48_15900 [Rhizomicrobium sp.]|jgi:hypothetical protein